MLLRYFVHTGYCGTNYKGWQRQPGVTTVQEVLENAFRTVLEQSIACIGCGRTDAGVHASQYFFHFDCIEPLPQNLVFVINKVLPNDIAIFDIIAVEGYPHAQYSATQRTYDYFIHTQKDPFLSPLSALYFLPQLNFEAMSKATSLLLAYENFSAFSRSPLKNKSNLCTIESALLFTNERNDRLRFQIKSKRFLQGMVRLIVQRLIDVGTGEISIMEFETYLAGTVLPKKVQAAYPQGLYLSKVIYPFLNLSEIRRDEDSFCLQSSSRWIII
jgi:tRNA pseudouridine38-40 synthase